MAYITSHTLILNGGMDHQKIISEFLKEFEDAAYALDEEGNCNESCG